MSPKINTPRWGHNDMHRKNVGTFGATSWVPLWLSSIFCWLEFSFFYLSVRFHIDSWLQTVLLRWFYSRSGRFSTFRQTSITNDVMARDEISSLVNAYRVNRLINWGAVNLVNIHICYLWGHKKYYYTGLIFKIYSIIRPPCYENVASFSGLHNRSLPTNRYRLGL